MRWEREEHDARLDGGGPVAGTPCPWCGDASKEGSGPCSEACEEALVSCATEPAPASWPADPPLPGEDCLRLAARGAYSRRERGQ